MRFQYDDGGRTAAGFKGEAGDCVTRAIAIVTEQSYRLVYETIDAACRDAARLKSRLDSKGKRRPGAPTGVPRYVWKSYLVELGWIWHATMKIGSGCLVLLC